MSARSGLALDVPVGACDQRAEARPDYKRALGWGLLSMGGMVPAMALAQAQPLEDSRAVAGPETSSLLDPGLNPADGRDWRPFGHQARGQSWFDRHGNWADTGTAVSADQYAAMPPAQQKAFAAVVGVEPAVGTADRALIYPAVGQVHTGELIDTRRSFRVEPDGSRTFGHQPVAGQLFAEGHWRDTGTLVSADQAAAMSESQRTLLGPDVRLGDPSRAVVEVDTRFDDPAMVQAARSRPGVLVTYEGFGMKPATAVGFARLEHKIGETFPGRAVRITATVQGRHTDPAHKQGFAVDFVVEGMTRPESTVLEKLCWQAGFKPYNEYVRSSRYKTGNHMHAQLVDR